MLRKTIVRVVKSKINEGVASILKELDLNLRIKPRFEYSFEALVKSFILKETKQIKSNRALANYIRNRQEDAISLGFLKDGNNNIKTPNRRTFDYFIRNHLDVPTKEVIEFVSTTIRETAEKFGLELKIDNAERNSNKSIILTNYQYQKNKD